MDLSRLKWPLAIIIVVAVVWLGSDQGVSWAESRLSQTVPGENAEADLRAEAGLSRLGGVLMRTFRYTRAEQVFEKALSRYPSGPNNLYNTYRLAKAKEKQGKYADAVRLLEQLMRANAHATDPRVANNDILRLRTDKLIEVHDVRSR